MAYDPSRPGIPTLYNGIQFRSRLEAKWAAFFDLLGWEYEYEPFDLDGWIPDFLIKGKPKDILVEVKPATFCPADVADEMRNACPGERHETEDWFRLDYELLVLGCSIPVDGEDDGLGWELDGAAGVLTASFGMWKGSKRIGYFCKDASWNDRISGEDGSFGPNWMEVNMDHVLKLWREAGSRVQWKGKRQTNKKARRRPLPSAPQFAPQASSLSPSPILPPPPEAGEAAMDEYRRKSRIRELEVELRNSANDPNGDPEHRRSLLEEYLRLITNRPGTKAKSAIA